MAPGTFLPENNAILIPDATLGTYFVTAGNIQNALLYTSHSHVGIMATSSRFEPDDSKHTTHNDNELDERIAHSAVVGPRQARRRGSCSPNKMHLRHEDDKHLNDNCLKTQNLKFNYQLESDIAKTITGHRSAEENTIKQLRSHQELSKCNSIPLDSSCRNEMHDLFYEYEDYTRECSSSLPKHVPSKWWPSAESRRNKPLSWEIDEYTPSQSPPRKHNPLPKNASLTKESVKENENPQELYRNFDPDHGDWNKDDALETSDHSPYQKPARARNYGEHTPPYMPAREHNYPASAQASHLPGKNPSSEKHRSNQNFNYATGVLEGDFLAASECQDHRDSGEAYVHRCPFHHCSHVRSVQNFTLHPKPPSSERSTRVPAPQILPKSTRASPHLTTSFPVSYRPSCPLSETSSEQTSQSTSPVLAPSSWSPPRLDWSDNSEPSTGLQGNSAALASSRGCSSTPCIPTMLPSHSPPQSSSSPPTFLPTSVLNTTHGHKSGMSAFITSSRLSDDFINNIDNASQNNNLSKANYKEIFVNEHSRFNHFQEEMQAGTEAEQHVCHATARSDSDHEMGDFFLEFRIVESPQGTHRHDNIKIPEAGAESFEPRSVEIQSKNERNRGECSSSIHSCDDELNEKHILSGGSSTTRQEYRANTTGINVRDHDEVLSRNLLNVCAPQSLSTYDNTNATQVEFNSEHAELNSTQEGFGYLHRSSPKELPRGSGAGKLSSEDRTHCAKKKKGSKTDRGSTQMTESGRTNKPALQEVTDSFRKKAIEYIVQQLSGQVGYTCCGGHDCTGAELKGDRCTTSDCSATDGRSDKLRNNDCQSTDCSATGIRSNTLPSDDCQSIDCDVTDTRTKTRQSKDCNVTDSRSDNLASNESKRTNYSITESRNNTHEDNKSTSYSVTDSSINTLEENKSNDYTRSAPITDSCASDSGDCAARQSIAGASNDRNWRHEASTGGGGGGNELVHHLAAAGGESSTNDMDHAPALASVYSTSEAEGILVPGLGDCKHARSGCVSDALCSVPVSSSLLEATALSMVNVSSTEVNSSSKAKNASSMPVNTPSGTTTSSSVNTLLTVANRSPVAENTPKMAVYKPLLSTNTSTTLSTSSTTLSTSSTDEPTPFSAVHAPLPPVTTSTAANTSLPAANPTPAHTSVLSANAQSGSSTSASANKLPLSAPSLQRLYKTVSKLEQTVFAAAKGDKEIYMRHLAGKLATVYGQLQHTQQLPVSNGGFSAPDRKNTTADTILTTQTYLRVKRQ